jgi:hypothetical protein
MKNDINFSLLNTVGWTEDRINDLQKALKRRRQFGFQNLSVGQRRVIIAADAALAKAEKVTRKAKADSRGMVQSKLHYRWVEFELSLFQKAEMVAGEVLADSIIQEEQLRSLRDLNPVLDTIDCSRRGSLDPMLNDLRALAADLGRVVSYDFVSHYTTVKGEFSENWDDRWSLLGSAGRQASALTEEQALEFRLLVRAEIENASSNLWPSVVARQAA